jgi:hypothetical protein
MIRHLKSLAPRAVVIAMLVLAAPVRAELPAAAFKQLPADTAFYSSMLRNREQIDIILKSKAWAKLMNMPIAKFAKEQIDKQLANPDPQFAMFVNMLKLPENQELLQVLADAYSDEIFVYGSSGWVDFIDLFMEVASAVRFGPALSQLNPENRGKNPAELMARVALQVLARNEKLIRVPDLIIGFKVKDSNKVEAQIKRLEGLVKSVIGFAPPFIGKGFSRVKIGDSSVLNLTVDTSAVPWDQLHIKDYEEKDGEFDPLLKKLKSLTLSISIGVHRGYVVLAIGQTADHLAVIGGEGKHLSELPEFKALEKFADKPLTSIGYTSKALKTALLPKASDYKDITTKLGELLKAADLPEASVKKIRADLDSMSDGLAKIVPEAGASVSFSFMTPRGTEAYDYDYTNFPSYGLDSSKPLSLLEHAGGQPIFFYAARSKSDPDAYKSFSKRIPVIYEHVEEAVLTKLDDDQKELYKTIKGKVVPLLQRLDRITGDLLLPALQDGQIGFVLDAKWKSKHWHVAAPTTPKAMPLPEIGFLMGISDEGKFKQAMKELYTLINDSLGVASELAKGEIPDIKMPEPNIEDGLGGLLAFYPIPPEVGIDAQFLPMVGLSKDLLVLTLSRSHTERLLKETPLKLDGGPLAEMKGKPVASAMYFNWPALVDTATPWLELAISTAKPPAFPPGTDGDVLKQTLTLLEICKVLRSFSNVTYQENGIWITHSETVIRDLE